MFRISKNFEVCPAFVGHMRDHKIAGDDDFPEGQASSFQFLGQVCEDRAQWLRRA
jgi:hypothetical protein